MTTSVEPAGAGTLRERGVMRKAGSSRSTLRVERKYAKGPTSSVSEDGMNEFEAGS
jgi:hypothetical protein